MGDWFIVFAKEQVIHVFHGGLHMLDLLHRGLVLVWPYLCGKGPFGQTRTFTGRLCRWPSPWWVKKHKIVNIIKILTRWFFLQRWIPFWPGVECSWHCRPHFGKWPQLLVETQNSLYWSPYLRSWLTVFRSAYFRGSLCGRWHCDGRFSAHVCGTSVSQHELGCGCWHFAGKSSVATLKTGDSRNLSHKMALPKIAEFQSKNSLNSRISMQNKPNVNAKSNMNPNLKQN